MKTIFDVNKWLSRESQKNVNNSNGTDAQTNDEKVTISTESSPNKDKVELLISLLDKKKVDITTAYSDYRDIAFALANEFGESGRSYFHSVSKYYLEYDASECDRQYSNCLKSSYGANRITIATFFYKLQQAGIHVEEKNVSTSTSSTSITSSTGTRSDDQSNNDEEEGVFSTPSIPREIYSSLPSPLKESVVLFEDGIEKDVFLVAALAALSGCFPNVMGRYMNEILGPQLYAFITAPAGSRKGTMKWARYFGQPIHEEKKRKYKEEYELYEIKLEQYNLADKKSRATMERPKEPARELFYIPANSSSSAFIKALDENLFRAEIFETEADTLASTFKQEWGSFCDVFRKAFHHETTSLMRRGGNEHIDIDNPHIAMVLSGTPKQVHSMMPEIENGLFSRFLFYAFVDESEFKNPFESHVDIDYIEFFEQRGAQIHELFNHLASRERAIEFKFTIEQGQKFTEVFKTMLRRNKLLLGRDFDANIKRLGVITFRIAMIFSVLRILEHGEYRDVILCDEIDFENAMKIALILEQHAVAVYKNLPKVKFSGNTKKFYDQLPSEFDRQTYLEVAKGLGIKEKTAEKYMTKFREAGLLLHEHNKYTKPMV